MAGILAGYGNDAQKEQFLKPLARGEMLGAFGLTEPHVGSDASAITTRAERKGDHYVLNGVKQFITTGKNADIAVVFAVTDKGAGKKGISAFVVPTKTPGYIVARIEEKTRPARIGHRADRPRELQVPASICSARKATAIASRSPTSSRAASASPRRRSAWRARRSRPRSPMPRERTQHGQGADRAPGGQLPARRHGDADRGRAPARPARGARCATPAQPCLKEASMAKLFASEMAERVCSDAIQIHGGYGYVADFPVERIYRDVRVTQIYEGASDIQRLVIGRTLRRSGLMSIKSRDQPPLGGIQEPTPSACARWSTT